MVEPPRFGTRGSGQAHSSARAARRGQHQLRSSLVAVVPPAYPTNSIPGVPPQHLPAAYPWQQKVPPTKEYDLVRYHKIPSGEVAYYGDSRYGPWFAEHQHEESSEEEGGEEGSEEGEDADEGEINTYPSDCTSGCDLKQSRMLEAAEGLVRVAVDTHTSREAAYKEQDTRNERWAKRLTKMLDGMAPAAANGVCHRTVDCEDCAGIQKEQLCRQKLGVWIPDVSVMKEANKEAAKEKSELN